jgi:glycosyltransferase involved in cell wall biosynthesis
MRICIATYDLTRTIGQGRINYELAYHLARRGHEVVLVSASLTPPLRDAPGVTWRRITIPLWVRGGLARYQAFALLSRRAIRRERYDILHLNGFTSYHPADVNVSMFVHAHWIRSPFYRQSRNGPVYSLYHRVFSALNAACERWAYRSARAVVALSPFVRDSLVTEHGIDPARIAVISPGVDTEEFRPCAPGEPVPVRELLSLPEDAFLLFFAGEIKSNRKNLDLALRTMARMDDRCHLIVAGAVEGSPYPALARELGVAGRTHFLGHRNDIATLMRGTDAFVFASHYDPYALVVTEAMASGVPVITAPSVGAAGVIRDGENGFVLPRSDDLDAVVRVVCRLRDDSSFARATARAARATAERLSWEAMTEEYEALYERILEEPASRCRAGCR